MKLWVIPTLVIFLVIISSSIVFAWVNDSFEVPRAPGKMSDSLYNEILTADPSQKELRGEIISVTNSTLELATFGVSKKLSFAKDCRAFLNGSEVGWQALTPVAVSSGKDCLIILNKDEQIVFIEAAYIGIEVWVDDVNLGEGWAVLKSLNGAGIKKKLWASGFYGYSASGFIGKLYNLKGKACFILLDLFGNIRDVI